MKKIYLKFLVITFFILVSMTFLSSSLSEPTYQAEIKKGFNYKSYKFDNFDEPNNINVIEIDSNAENIEIKPTISNGTVIGTQFLRDQANLNNSESSTVLAGINCDMFIAENNMTDCYGIPLNSTIINGVLYNSTLNMSNAKNFPVFGVTNENNPFIGHIYITCDIKITTANGKEYIAQTDMLNRNYGLNNRIGIFTKYINDESTVKLLDSENNVNSVDKEMCNFYVVSSSDNINDIKAGINYTGKIEAIVRKETEIKIPDNCIVIADVGNKLYYPKVGQKIDFSFTVNEIDEKNNIIGNKNNLMQCVGAYNWIVKDGVVQTEEIFSEKRFPPINYIVNTKTAKTGIGIKNDGTILAATVDKNHDSSGMTMEEFGELFLSLGCVNAINFDGGASTEMILINKNDQIVTVNIPENGGCREIATGLLFLSKDNKYKGFDEPGVDMYPIIIGAILCIMTLTMLIKTTIKIIKKHK